jgi:Domain of unknown function (DUF4091)
MKLSIIGKQVFPAIFLYSAASITPLMAQNNPVVWTAPSLHRVGMTEEAGGTNQVRLSAARGEYESFQIIANGSSKGLSNVNVTVSDLQGPNGQVIPKANFTLFREKYMHVTSSSPNWGGSNKPLGPGWYADALIPFLDPATGKAPTGGTLKAVPFDVKANNNQPVWVDLLVPRGAAPGGYSGSYTVTSDQGNFTGNIALTVWNFSLPAAPALKSSFLFFQAGTLAAQQEMVRNKLQPASSSPSDQARLKEFGLNTTNVGPFSGADIGRCSMTSAPSVDHFKALAKAQQPGLMLYDYSADEIGKCSNLYPTIKQWAKNMHEAGINNLISMSPTPALYDDGSGTGRSAVDIWVVLPVMYNNSKANIDHVIKKGDAVWSYNTLVQDAYSPKWEIDFDPVNFRIQPGFINQSLNLTGMLYWRVDRWNSDPWNNINNAGTYASSNYPGEGALVYPGKQVGVDGVVASMRVKWLRDGVEDFDYVQILKDLGKADLAMQISRSVGPDWTNWTRDRNAIESARQKLGEAINEVMNQRQGKPSNPPAGDEAVASR